ncbi:protein FAM32A [Hetaerina americana]|uniref:protein FAM32A n=1 Tax=Hetaerina americana TaxID=62018 RepID=UPI003A7F5585
MEYEGVVKGPLRLKGDSGVKKKKKKDKKQIAERIPKVNEVEQSELPKKEIKRTPAEEAFLKMQEKMQRERIKQKASMTHKQRVEEFNRYLDTLTEHFDIPKVSWTK